MCWCQSRANHSACARCAGVPISNGSLTVAQHGQGRLRSTKLARQPAKRFVAERRGHGRRSGGAVRLRAVGRRGYGRRASPLTCCCEGGGRRAPVFRLAWGRSIGAASHLGFATTPQSALVAARLTRAGSTGRGSRGGGSSGSGASPGSGTRGRRARACSTSSRSQPTELGPRRSRRGNSPASSRRRMVALDNPVTATTSGIRIMRRGISCAPSSASALRRSCIDPARMTSSANRIGLSVACRRQYMLTIVVTRQLMLTTVSPRQHMLAPGRNTCAVGCPLALTGIVVQPLRPPVLGARRPLFCDPGCDPGA